MLRAFLPHEIHLFILKKERHSSFYRSIYIKHLLTATSIVGQRALFFYDSPKTYRIVADTEQPFREWLSLNSSHARMFAFLI